VWSCATNYPSDGAASIRDLRRRQSHQRGIAVPRDDVADRHQHFMTKASQRFELALQSRQRFVIANEMTMQSLQRNDATRRDLFGAIYAAGRSDPRASFAASIDCIAMNAAHVVRASLGDVG
jgi:hypothetical protein